MTENTGILIDALLNKASLKQYIFKNTINNFEILKTELKELITVIQTNITQIVCRGRISNIR